MLVINKTPENRYLISNNQHLIISLLSSEKKAAVREFEDKKVYLKEQLIAELEEKQKMIEQVRYYYSPE